MTAGALPLNMIRPGKEVTLVSIAGGRGIRMRLADLGLNEGMRIKVVQSHRWGPCVIMAGNTRLIIGHGVAGKVFVTGDE